MVDLPFLTFSCASMICLMRYLSYKVYFDCGTVSTAYWESSVSDTTVFLPEHRYFSLVLLCHREGLSVMVYGLIKLAERDQFFFDYTVLVLEEIWVSCLGS